MNKVTPRLLSILCCLMLLSGSSAPAFAQARAAQIVHRPAASLAIPAVPAAISPMVSPALAGGASLIKGAPLLAPAAPAMPAAPAAAVAPALALPAARAAASAEGPEGPDAAKNPADAKSQAGDLAGKLGERGADASGVSRAAFDGGNGGGNDGSAPVASDGSPLNQYYPRAVFIQDVFSGPASEKTVEYVNKLVDAGVHVVFLTRRAQKGEDSAESVLLSRVKQSRNNPVIVVSHNGGKVALHGRAANPKGIIESVGAFPEAALAKIREIAGDAVVASPSESEAFSVAMPLDLASQSQAQAVAALNRKLKSAGLDYKAEAHPTQAGAAIVYSMPLRFSIARVFQALEAQFPGEGLSSTPDKFLILADSVKSPKFSTSFPKQAEVQVVQNGAAVENLLGAVLGDRTLEAVSLKLGKLRQFVEYWEPSKRRVPSPDSDGSGSGGGSSYRGGDRKTSQMFAMYVGTLMFTMMARLYDDIFRGQHQNAKLTVLQAQLRQMWYNPMKYGVYVNKQLAASMKTAAWKAMSRGYLEYANAYLTNYYLREFGDYPRAAKNVQENYVGLSTDRKSLITLEFKSAATGKIYKIHTRIPRVMKLETAEGLTLTAYAYRTGKETPDDGEEFLARVLAMALLKGHARKGADGKWHHGSPEGPVIAKLRVQLEYRSSHRALVYDTADFLKLEEGREVNGPIVQEIISAIEREEADAEYQQYWKEQDQQASKEDMKKSRKPSAKAKPAAKPKTAKAKVAAKAKPAVKAKPARRAPRGGK